MKNDDVSKDAEVVKTIKIPETLHGASRIHWGMTILEIYIVETHGEIVKVKYPTNHELTGITYKIQIAGKEITYFLREGKGEIQVIKKEGNI